MTFDITKHKWSDRVVDFYCITGCGKGVSLSTNFCFDDGTAILALYKPDIIALARYFKLTNNDIEEKK